MTCREVTATSAPEVAVAFPSMPPEPRSWQVPSRPPDGVRLTAVVLLWIEGGLLAATLPVQLFVLAFSLFEGGDLQRKHRLQEWVLASFPIAVTGVVLVGCSAVMTHRARSDVRGIAAAAAGALAFLAIGWVWVMRGDLIGSPGLLVLWLALTLPGLVGLSLAVRSRRSLRPSVGSWRT